MSCDASDGGEPKICDTGSPVLVDQNIRLRRRLGCKCGRSSFGRNKTYSFQISVDYAEIVHVLQAIRNASQLKGLSARLLQGQVTIYKFSTVHVAILLNEFIDVSIFHPLGNQSKPMFVQCHPKQR